LTTPEAFTIELADRARREVGSFEKMDQHIRSIAGLVELLSQAIDNHDSGHTDCINWRAVLGSLALAQAQLGPICSATAVLAEIDNTLEAIANAGSQKGAR